MITQKVALREVRFYSPIGFYEEEQVIGNEFFLNLEVIFPFENSDAEDLKNTINYEELYQILEGVMRPKRKLIESALEDILDMVLKKYTFVQEVNVVIRKVNPPFGGDLANSEVSLVYKRD
ncbi:dihydroneopterin aldolase [Sphingobacterium bovistauri]|uniref:7,8-dihydroneopterin aldolase n=1 Tax=Sphingobacterium bovistauri TaxID=2781959 RepID=A0ABS7ZAE3_9SPHI|nr:dihydroneopterin aldolase [Sphingobacterium bovistauri]MCA5005830.1 dihydroneopterin aldolase [Sphingobacterium bovistauri]